MGHGAGGGAKCSGSFSCRSVFELSPSEEYDLAREMSDWEVYEEGSMKGGLAFSEQKLRYLLSPHFTCLEFLPSVVPEDDATFGMPFLWASLWRKAEALSDCCK